MVADRGMATPALLFLVSHRPLAFVTGQLLYALQPLAGLLDVDACAAMAGLLSEPQGVQALETALAARRESHTSLNGCAAGEPDKI